MMQGGKKAQAKLDPFATKDHSESRQQDDSFEDEQTYLKEHQLDFGGEEDDDEADLSPSKSNATQQKEDVKEFYQIKRQLKTKAPRLLSINDPRKTQWDLFVMLLATFNVFVIPLDVGFEPQSF